MALSNDEGGMLGRMDSKQMGPISPRASTWGQEVAQTPKSKGNFDLDLGCCKCSRGLALGGGREEQIFLCQCDGMTAPFLHEAQGGGDRLPLPRGKGSAGNRQGGDRFPLQGGGQV